jgi:hypothetical protein
MRTGLVAAAVAISPIGWGSAWAQELEQIFAKRDNASAMTIDHAPWGEILKAYLKPSPDGINRFAYSKVTKPDRAKLKAYLAALQGVTVAKLNEAEQRAFWANLYNALTIEVILEHYPVKTIRDISISPGFFAVGPWGKPLVTVEGRTLSLDDIEHKILRKVWRDPRTHYSVNCASIGCPNLPDAPFTGKTLEAMLDAGAKAYVNHPRGVSVAPDGRVTASRIYNWFVEDFGGNEQGVLAHLSAHAGPGLKAKLKAAGRISAYEYDWSLNDAR